MNGFPKDEAALQPGDVCCYREGDAVGLACVVSNDSDAEWVRYYLEGITRHSMSRIFPTGRQFSVTRLKSAHGVSGLWKIYPPERYWHWYDMPVWEMCWATTARPHEGEGSSAWTVRVPSWQGGRLFSRLPRFSEPDESTTAQELAEMLEREGWIELELAETAAYARWRIFRGQVLVSPKHEGRDVWKSHANHHEL